MHWRSPLAGLFTTALVVVAGLGPAATAAEASSAARCSRRAVWTHNRILTVDTRSLARCATAVLEESPFESAERRCRDLRTAGAGLDRRDARMRKRLAASCEDNLPLWLPPACTGPGAARGMRITGAGDMALCVAASSHCLAARSIQSIFGDITEPLALQNSGNLAFEFGQLAGNSFSNCLGATLASTTTSTTSTTTTTTMPRTDIVVISEIMADPRALPDTRGEYFELWNGSDHALDLEGWMVSDLGSDSFTIKDPLPFPAGGRVVLARSEDAAGGRVDYVYGGSMTLANSNDEIIVMRDGTVLDMVAYGSLFPRTAGHSMELDDGLLDALENDSASAWCVSALSMADGDYGSPQESATPCP